VDAPALRSGGRGGDPHRRSQAVPIVHGKQRLQDQDLRMRLRLGVAGGLALALAVFSIAVQSGRLAGFDQAVHAVFERIWWQPTFPVFDGIAVLAGIELTSVASALLFLLLAWRRRRRDAAAILAFPIALAVEALAKLVVNHPPPPLTHAGRLTVTTAA
jgi:hypothetical protein